MTIRAADDPEFGPNLFMYGESSDQTESGRIRFVEGVGSSNWRGAYIHYDGQVNALFIGGHNTNSNSTQDDSNQIIVKRSGGVGINVYPENHQLELDGVAYKNTGSFWQSTSDARLKTNIRTLDGRKMLEKVLSMRGVSYEWDDNYTGYSRPAGKQIGFTAQDLQKVWPEKVSVDKEGFLMTAYGDFDPVFVESIKELKNQIDQLRKELLAEKAKSKVLESRLDVLEIKNN